MAPNLLHQTTPLATSSSSNVSMESEASSSGAIYAEDLEEQKVNDDTVPEKHHPHHQQQQPMYQKEQQHYLHESSSTSSPTYNNRRPLLMGLQLLVYRSTSILTLLTGLLYLIMRFRAFALDHTWLGLPFIICEAFLYSNTIFALFIAWRPMKTFTPQERLLHHILPTSTSSYPTVDVFIPCYTEPVQVIKESLLAAMRLDYPKEKLCIYVLDDGSNPETRDMVHAIQHQQQFIDVRYIARLKQPGLPHFAKAGNLNNALLGGLTKGEFIAVFDCDMIASPLFLKKTLPHFYERKDGEDKQWEVKQDLGYVQTPQDFYNTASRDPLCQRQAFFYDWEMMCWAGRNMSLCVGTGTVFRRKALTSIGGWGVHSVTEDVLTSYLLNAAGYKGFYLHERLAFGLNPTNVHDFFIQRERWCVGSLEILRDNNPLFKKGLKWYERIHYFHAYAGYFQCIPLMVVLTMPLFFLFNSAIVLCDMSVYQWLALFLPYYLSYQFNLAFSIWLSGSGMMYYTKIQCEAIYLVFMKVTCILIVYLPFKDLDFLPTPKQRKNDASSSSSSKNTKESTRSVYSDLQHVIGHCLYLLLVTIALFVWFLRFSSSAAATTTTIMFETEHIIAYTLNTFWVVCFALSMMVPLLDIIRGFGSESDRSFEDFLRESPIGRKHQSMYLLEGESGDQEDEDVEEGGGEKKVEVFGTAKHVNKEEFCLKDLGHFVSIDLALPAQ